MMHASLLGPHGFAPATGIPLSDRGFRYGMSVFETIAVRAGAPLLLDLHLERLAESAAAAGFRPPAHWTSAARHALVPPPIREGLARLYVTGGDHDGSLARVALLGETTPIPLTLSSALALTVEFSPATPFGKTGNYWPHFLARPATGEEPLLCAPDGALLSGAVGNLFLVRGGELLTPAHPIRRGVVREWLLREAGAREAPLTRADLETAEAAFLTNSRVGICQLTSIDGHELDRSHGSYKSYKTYSPPALWHRYRTEVLNVR